MAEGSPQSLPLEATSADNGIYLIARSHERLYQGELLAKVIEWAVEYDPSNRDIVAAAKPVELGLAIVLSQDCDLEQDFRQRKDDPWVETDLRCVIVCPAFPAEQLRHDLGPQKINSARWNTIRNNKDERYAYLAEVLPSSDSAGTGCSSMLLDLSNYLTVRTPELYRQMRLGEAKPRCRLQLPWREHLQMRFATYLSRIGLPRDHFVPEARRTALPAPGGPTVPSSAQ